MIVLCLLAIAAIISAAIGVYGANPYALTFSVVFGVLAYLVA